MKDSQAIASNPLEEWIGYNLRRASALMMADLAKRLDRLGLTPTEASLVMLIEANPGINQTELGRNLGIQRANMAPLTSNLVDRGLVARRAAVGRSQGLQVTPKGRTVASSASKMMKTHEEYFLKDITATDRNRIMALLDRIRHRFPDGDGT